MKTSFRRAGRIYLQTVLAYVMCFILYLSFTTIFLGLGTSVIGYQTYEVNESGDKIMTGEYYFEVGEQISYPTDQKYVQVRSQQPTSVFWIEQIIAQAVAIGLFVFFLNGTVSKMAASDRTAAMYQGERARPWLGFLLGGLAAIPAFLWYIVLIVCRFIGKEIMQLEYLFNYVFYSYLRMITGNLRQSSGLNPVMPPLLADLSFGSYLGMLVPVIAVPLICGICYYFAFRKIHLGESIMYHSKKEK